MGLLRATLLVAIMVLISEAQVIFPRNTISKDMECTASNGQPGFCYEFRSAKFKGCSFFPSQNTRNPNVARHLTNNICKNTGREVYFCCPSTTAPPKRSCATVRCQSNAQCVEGSGSKPTKCNCKFGYRSHQDMCIATCKVNNCQANALCVEGSGASASVCLCKKDYRSHNGKCLPTCQTTNCPKNARCLEGSGSTSTSCKCKNGFKSTKTACIELRPQTAMAQRLNQNNLSTQGFSGSSSHSVQRNSWNQFRNQYYAPTHNPYRQAYSYRQNARI